MIGHEAGEEICEQDVPLPRGKSKLGHLYFQQEKHYQCISFIMMKDARKEPDMILIVGASGRLGSVVVRHLLAQGKSLRVMTRDSRGLARLKLLGVETVQGARPDRPPVVCPIK